MIGPDAAALAVLALTPALFIPPLVSGILRRIRKTTQEQMWATDSALCTGTFGAYAVLQFSLAIYTPGNWPLLFGTVGLIATGISSLFWHTRHQSESDTGTSP